jgi:hypothetical protein
MTITHHPSASQPPPRNATSRKLMPRVTTRDITAQLDIGHNATQDMPESLLSLGSSTAEARAQKFMRGCVIAVASLTCCRGDDFLLNIVASDESWSTVLTSKQNDTAWNSITLPSPRKKARTVFWDAEGCLLANFLPRKGIVNAVFYVFRSFRNCDMKFPTNAR